MLFVSFVVGCALFAAVHTAPASNPRVYEELQRILDDHRYATPEVTDSLSDFPPNVLDLLGQPLSSVETVDEPEEKNLFADEYFYETPLTSEIYGMPPQVLDAVRRDIEVKTLLGLPLFDSQNSFVNLNNANVDNDGNDNDANELEIDKRRQKIVFQEKKRAKERSAEMIAAASHKQFSRSAMTSTTAKPETIKHLRIKGHNTGQKEIAVLRPADRKQSWTQQQQKQQQQPTTSTTSDDHKMTQNVQSNDILTSELDNLTNEKPYQA